MSKRIKDAVTSVCVSVVVVLVLTAIPLWASQNNLYNPTTGTLSGLTMVQGFNNALDSVNTCNSGGSAPSNQLSGTPSAGNCWYNTATGAVQFYDGAQWLTVGTIDAANHVFTPVVGGGAAASVASAATTNLCGAAGAAPTQSFLSVTGTAAISSFGSNCVMGQVKILSFASTAQLTFNAATMILPTAANITAGAGDIAVAIYLGSGNWQVALYQRATGAALSSAGLSLGASSLASSALSSFGQPVNLQINGTVASNQLTVAVKGINGSDASSSNPILVNFRDASGTGTQVAGSLQAALSFTLATTSSLGCTTLVVCRVWITAVCQTISAGVCTSILVGLSSQSAFSSSAASCLPLDEASLQNTGSGTAGGTGLATIYTSVSALSSKPIRIIGYLEAVWTSGTGWASPSNIQIFGPGVHRPCEPIQTKHAFSTSATAASASPTVTTPSVSITPFSKANLMRVTAHTIGQQSGGSTAYLISQIFRATGGSAACTTPLGTVMTTGGGASTINELPNRAWDAPQTTSQITYDVCASASAGGTYCVNNVSSTCDLDVEEIMGMIEREPTNADWQPASQAISLG